MLAFTFEIRRFSSSVAATLILNFLVFTCADKLYNFRSSTQKMHTIYYEDQKLSWSELWSSIKHWFILWGLEKRVSRCPLNKYLEYYCGPKYSTLYPSYLIRNKKYMTNTDMSSLVFKTDTKVFLKAKSVLNEFSS